MVTMLPSMSFESDVLMGLASEATQLNDAGSQEEGALSHVSMRAASGRVSLFF